jgi:predicted aspartyl protease
VAALARSALGPLIGGDPPGEKLTICPWFADLIRDTFKRGKYQDVILPLTDLRRLDCVLAPTKPKVLETRARHKGKLDDLGPQLRRASGFAFYNTSRYDFDKLLAEAPNLAANLRNYIAGGEERARPLIPLVRDPHQDKAAARRVRHRASCGARSGLALEAARFSAAGRVYQGVMSDTVASVPIRGTVQAGPWMGTFFVEVQLAASARPERRETIKLLVDRGSTYTSVSATTLRDLGVQPPGRRRILTIEGRAVERGAAEVLITLEGRSLHTLYLFGEAGDLEVLGAYTLERFGLTIDPVQRRLIPAILYGA